MTMSIKVKNGDKGERGALRLFHPIVAELTDGTINIDEQVELDNADKISNRNKLLIRILINNKTINIFWINIRI